MEAGYRVHVRLQEVGSGLQYHESNRWKHRL